MWLVLRELPTEHRFRRQHPIGCYVVDFACPDRKLAIEFHGGQHAQQEEEDAARTPEIARRGYRIIRFWNNDVMHNLAGVLDHPALSRWNTERQCSVKSRLTIDHPLSLRRSSQSSRGYPLYPTSHWCPPAGSG